MNVELVSDAAVANFMAEWIMVVAGFIYMLL
jgi:hypothetical protein